jgi:plasmid stabilization system protein ParE
VNVSLSTRALGDLDRIYAYIFTHRGQDAAEAFLARARRATEFVAENPLSGPHPNWAARHKSLRFWPISGTRFLIFYIANESAISIERVLDGRRDVVALLEQGAEESFEDE